MASFVFGADGTVRSSLPATAPMNGSTLLLPARLSDLGAGPASGPLTYGLTAFELRKGHEATDAVAGRAAFSPGVPALAQGQSVPLDPGASATLDLASDAGAQAASPALGWMVVSLDNGDGAAQADLVPLDAGVSAGR
jgi:minor extracellular serine protease Vpr